MRARWVGALAVAGATLALSYRSKAEAVLAMTLALIVGAAVWSTVVEVWTRPVASAAVRAPSWRWWSLVGRFVMGQAERVPGIRGLRSVRRVDSVYAPVEQLRRKLSMARTSEFDASVHLRPIIVEIVAASPDCARQLAVRRVLELPNARTARRDGGGLSTAELLDLVDALEGA